MCAEDVMMSFHRAARQMQPEQLSALGIIEIDHHMHGR